jgi:hypothetical protein
VRNDGEHKIPSLDSLVGCSCVAPVCHNLELFRLRYPQRRADGPPEYPIPIYLMSGVLALLAVWSVSASAYRFWGKVFLSCLSVAIVVLTSFLGAIFEFFHSGFNLGP